MNKLQLKIFRKKYQLTQKDLARIASVVRQFNKIYNYLINNVLRIFKIKNYMKFA